MKKQYVVLSILGVLVITFGVLSGVFFDRYVDITKEIVGMDTGYLFTAFIPFIGTNNGEETTTSIQPRERPDTSALRSKADVSLTLGIIFTVIASIMLILLVLWIIKILKVKRKETSPLIPLF